MKFTYKTINRKSNSYTTIFQAVGEPVFCCKEMEEAYNDNYIHFGEYDSSMLNCDNNLNIMHCSPYSEGASWSEFAIKFCPFCAERIEMVSVNTTDRKES